MSVSSNKNSTLLFKTILVFLLLADKVFYVRDQLIDDEEDESVEDETSEEKATRKSIKEDSYLTVVSNDCLLNRLFQSIVGLNHIKNLHSSLQSVSCHYQGMGAR